MGAIMGKWLAALKKYKNGGSANTQNLQNPLNVKIGSDNDNKKNNGNGLNPNTQNPQNYQTGGFEGFECSDYGQKQNFFLNNTPHDDGDFSSAGMLTNVDIAESKPSSKTGHATKPRTLKIVESYNSKTRSDDAEVYARALKLHGAMSYGMAMQVLEWGATRAANAQDQLREAGRVEFNHLGWAVLVKDC